MSTPVRPAPDGGDLVSYAVGQPVSRGHGVRMVDTLAFLLGYAGCHPIADCYLLYNDVAFGVSGACTVPVAYARNPGAHGLLIAFELFGGSGDSCTVSLTLSTGSVVWIGQQQIDGSSTLRVGAGDLLQPTTHFAVLDVSAFTVGTILEIRLNIASPSAGFRGMDHLHVAEIPMAAFDPVGSPSTESGLAAGWPDVRNRIVQGSPTGSSIGTIRYVAQLDAARQVKRHLQFVGHDDTGTGVCYATSGGSTTTLGKLQCRQRALYGTGTNNTYTVQVTYRTTNNTTAGSLTVTDTASNTVTISLPQSVTRTRVTGTISLDTSATDVLTDLTIAFHRTAGAGTVLISNVALIEAET